jgi:hypothetical protein
MPRTPIGISDEIVVARTILLLTPLLKSAALHSPAFVPFENNPERVRAQQLKMLGTTAVQSSHSSHPAHMLSVGSGVRQTTRFAVCRG